jgi:hypothetical protein
MTIATVANSVRQLLNTAPPAQLVNQLQAIRLGDVLNSAPRVLRRCNPNAAGVLPYVVAGQAVAESVTGSNPAVSPGANLLGQLPDDAKAAFILRATAMAGTGTPIELIVDAGAANVTSFATAGTGPASTHIGVTPSGDIATNATDAWTSVDVWYVPESVDVFEFQLAPASGVITLPTSCNLPGAVATTPATVLLMEAEILTGTVTGKCAVLPQSNSAPGATKQANLNLAKTQVLFKVSDAPTLARIKIGVCRTCNGGVNANQVLEAIAAQF